MALSQESAGTRGTISCASRLLLTPKLVYFALGCVFYAFYVFRAAFMQTYLKLDSVDFGDLSAIMALVSFPAMAFWGTLSDRCGRHRLVLVLLTAGLAGAFSLFLIPWRREAGWHNYLLSLATLSLYSLFSSGVQPLTDYQVLRMLRTKEMDSRDQLGRQKMWETIAYGLVTYLIGTGIDYWGVEILFVWIPVAAAVFVAVLLAFGVADEGRGAAKQDEERVCGKPPIWKLLSNPSYLFLLLVVFMVGSARTVMSTFLSKYLQEYLHLQSRQVATASASGIVFEAAIFCIAPWCLGTFGVYWMLVFAQTAMVVRAWIYVVLPPTPSSAWFVYGVELLKGFAFGCTTAAGVKLASAAAPAGLEATAQAIYTGVYSQLPAVLAASVGGRVYKAFGPAYLFWGTSIVSSCALVLFVAKYTLDGSIRPFWGQRLE